MRAVCLLLVLAACAPGPETGFNPHTGVASRASGVATLDRRYPARFEVRAVRLWKDGAERFALLTFVTRSDRTYPRVETAWAMGTPLPYETLDRRRAGIGRQESGVIAMTRAEVQRAAREGLALQLIGRRGSYAGLAGADLFRALLAE